MFDIFKGVNYLHCLNPPVIHRDIKPENILFKEGKLKLADFGWSNIKDSVRHTFCGTRDYLAPEMILKTGHDEKLDVWTLGILTFEVLTGKAPFSPSVDCKTVGQIKQELEFNIINKNPKFPEYLSESAVDFIKKLLEKDPGKRPSCEQALQHAWFK
jgi:serine/threonine protein kinase